MRLLVTGGCGFIGSSVIRTAMKRGFEILNLDALTYAANPDNLETIADRPGYRFVKADIRDAGAVAAALQDFQPEAIMHLAAESHVDRSIDGPLEFVDTNVAGTANLLHEARKYLASLDSARAAAFRFHHVSTDEVYGSLGAEGAFTEQSPYAPNSPYSASKASSDMLVRAWQRTYGFPAVISNCSNNYGPFQFPEKLIPVVILNALAGAAIPVYGRGENVRDWLYVDDHADALLTILQAGQPGEIYNVGGDAERSNIELVRMICAILDKIRPAGQPHAELIDFVTDRPGHDFRYAIDARKLKTELGWTPSTTIDKGLRETVEWYLANLDWCRKALARVSGKTLPERLGAG